MTIDEIAKVTYEVNRAYCESMGDHSFGPWEEAPKWQKETHVQGVIFHLANPDKPPSASHESWYAMKVTAGWEYGPVKDPKKRTHPCMVPFDRLPKQQQAKDYLFKAVVDSLKGFIVEMPAAVLMGS